MSTPEAIFSLIGIIFQFGAGIGCLYAAWLTHGMIRRERRIEHAIRKLYAYADANCSMGYISGIKDVAELLGIELEESNGDD